LIYSFSKISSVIFSLQRWTASIFLNALISSVIYEFAFKLIFVLYCLCYCLNVLPILYKLLGLFLIYTLFVLQSLHPIPWFIFNVHANKVLIQKAASTSVFYLKCQKFSLQQFRLYLILTCPGKFLPESCQVFINGEYQEILLRLYFSYSIALRTKFSNE
jgi:hypothetical protein